MLLALAALAAPPVVAETMTADDPVAAVQKERAELQVPRMIHQSRAALDRADQALRGGDEATARTEIDCAIAYDPGSVRAYLAKARHAGSPRASLRAYAGVFEAARYGYPNQLVFSLNTTLVLLWSLTLGLLGTGGAIVFRYVRHVHHTIYESLQRRLGRNAAFLAAVLLFVPALWGTGLVPLVMFFLLWFRSIMRPRERTVVFALGAVAAIVWAVHTFAPGPLKPPGDQHGPYRVGVAAETAGTTGYMDDLDLEEPAGYVSWVRGLAAKRRGDLDAAYASYSAALEQLPDAAGIHTNIGNVHYLRRELEAALASYDRAIQLSPSSPEPHLNRSQVLTDLVDFIGADKAMEKAMLYGYERVQPFLDSHEDDSRRAVMDVLPSQAALWRMTLEGTSASGDIPTPEGFMFLFPGGQLWLTPFLLVIMSVVGYLAGQWLERSVKTYACTSCGRIICRRCLIRVDANPYCLDCGQTLRAECSAEYSRALLERYFQRGFSVRSALSGAVRWLLPGWAEVSEWPVLRSVFVLSLCGAALLIVSLRALPIPGYPADSPSFASDPLVWGLSIVLYAVARLATWRWSRTTREDEYEDDLDERDFGHVA